jgi:hypothetical protein
LAPQLKLQFSIFFFLTDARLSWSHGPVSCELTNAIEGSTSSQKLPADRKFVEKKSEMQQRCGMRASHEIYGLRRKIYEWRVN